MTAVIPAKSINRSETLKGFFDLKCTNKIKTKVKKYQNETKSMLTILKCVFLYTEN